MFTSYAEYAQQSGWEEGRRLLGLAGRTCFNVCELLVERNCERAPTQTALIARDHQGGRRVVDFAQLRVGVGRFASVLDTLGVRKGDRVFTLLEPVPELYFAILGAIRAGAVAGPLFPAFGVEAVTERLGNAEARVLVTNARHLHKARQAVANVPSVEALLVVGEADLAAGEFDLAALMEAADPERSCTATTADDPMLLHYTSGTTGKPKGVVHAHEALVGHAITARDVLDLRPDDCYWCTADPGWVTGTSYGIFGPWANGVTQVTLAAGFSSDLWYQVLQEEHVTVWYTAPTALRMLKRDGAEAAARYDLSSIRHICSVGEPLNPEVIRWGEETYGHTIRDTWWQTETGCMQIVNTPFMPVRPGSMGRPVAGVTAAIIAPDTFEPQPPQTEGLLALRPDSPALFRGYWRNEATTASKFRNGWYLSGDRAYVDEDGYFWYLGRDDEVINTSGHLVGPFEIESALLHHPAVIEAAAFGIPADDVGEAVAVSVVLRAGHDVARELPRDLKTLVRRQVGAYAVPREIIIAPRLPRTRSGKIMRRVVRAEYLGLPVGDLSGRDND